MYDVPSKSIIESREVELCYRITYVLKQINPRFANDVYQIDPRFIY